MRHRVLGELR